MTELKIINRARSLITSISESHRNQINGNAP